MSDAKKKAIEVFRSDVSLNHDFPDSWFVAGWDAALTDVDDRQLSKICPCGFNQSMPVPHEHDRTSRERDIIDSFEERILELNVEIERLRGKK